jgi:hypothetical protein
MKRNILSLFAILAAVFAISASAQDIVNTIEKGCAAEIEKFCSQVSPGEGRMLACFFAHEDKLSGQCQYALYTASTQLEHAVSALNYVAGQCDDDIVEHCAEVELGEGRILDCLDAKKEAVSAACTQAIADVFE